MAPSVLDKIMTVIKEQNTPGGSSRPALSKGLKTKYGEISAAAVKTAIKKGVDSGKLVQSGQKFWVAGHEPPPPPVEVRTAREVTRTQILGEPDRSKNNWFPWSAIQRPLIEETPISSIPPTGSLGSDP